MCFDKQIQSFFLLYVLPFTTFDQVMSLNYASHNPMWEKNPDKECLL